MARSLIAFAIAGLALVFFMGGAGEAGDKGKDPKYTIKEVMKTAMKGGLCGKVANGKASDDEKKQLVALFEALAANKCPKGEADSWKEKTSALVAAVKANDTAALKKAADCKGCHSAHK